MDRRDRQARYGNWWDSFDAKRMVLTIDDATDWFFPDADDSNVDDIPPAEFPAKYAVCDLCDGKGTHVNPSIDAHGISADEFDNDPDFAEDYMRGRYDVQCYACNGLRVVPVVDRDRLKQTAMGRVQLKRLDDFLGDRADTHRIEEAERRMGA